MRIKFVLSLLFAALGAMFATNASAEPDTVTIPGKGWTVSFDAPPFKAFRGQTQGEDFVFEANTGKTGFNLSLFVEKPKNKEEGNDAVYNTYWPMAKRNPLIDQKST